MSEINKENIDRNIDRRELNKEEEEALFALYCKHNGNHSAMSRDPDCGLHNVVIGDFAKKYSFKERMLKKVKEDAERTAKEWNETLKAGKMKAIIKAISLLEPQRITKTKKDGTLLELVKEPEAKAVKIAYEILKTELGEPTTISKNTNIDENPEVKETIDGIRQLIKQGQDEQNNNDEQPSDNSEAIQSGGEAISNIS